MAGNSYTSYSLLTRDGQGRGSFGYLSAAKKKAQEIANDTGASVIIQQHRSDGKRAKSYSVSPKKVNPAKVLPRGKWINAKVRVTKNGKIEACISRSAVKNPFSRLKRTKGIMTGAVLASRRRTPKNKRYLAYIHTGGDGKYASTLENAKKTGRTLARKARTPHFFIQNQITGSVVQYLDDKY